VLPRLLTDQRVAHAANIIDGRMTAHGTLDTNTHLKIYAESESKEQIASTIETHAAFTMPNDGRAPADRQQIFLMYRELFAGSNVRKRRTIRKIVLKHLLDTKASADEAHINNIVSILKSLLEDRVFQSEDQASKHFPDLSTTLPLERPTGNISKKRKASAGRSVNIGQVLQAEAVDKGSIGTTAGMHFNHSFV
jgi:hypothetical protein